MSDNTKQSGALLRNFGGISEKYIAEADPERKPEGKKISKAKIFFICAGYAAAILLFITANLPDRSDNDNYTPVVTSVTAADSQMTEGTMVTTSVTSVRAPETTSITENTVVIPVEGTLVTNQTGVNENIIITDETRKNEGGNEEQHEEQPAVQIPETVTEKPVVQITETVTEKPDVVKETVLVTDVKEIKTVDKDLQSGVYGKNITWQYDTGNKTLTLSGSGPMEFDLSDEDEDVYVFENRYSWAGDVEHVVVSEGVESLSYEAFWKFASLKTVSLPESLKEIGSEAFKNCVSLESVTIPSGVTEIRLGTFMNCNSLESVNIPEGVTSINEEAFKGCCSLKSLVIPQSVTKIENHAFENCLTLREVVIYGPSVDFDSMAFDSADNNSMLVLKGCGNTQIYAAQNWMKFERLEGLY